MRDKIKSVALLGSWDPQWIEEHQAWLLAHGPHDDGWKNRVSAKNLQLLEERISTVCYFRFYAYMPTSKKGCGRIAYRLECDRIRYSKVPQSFSHKYGKHEGPADYDARLRFRINKIHRLDPMLEVEGMVTVAGKIIRGGQGTLSMPTIWDPAR